MFLRLTLFIASLALLPLLMALAVNSAPPSPGVLVVANQKEHCLTSKFAPILYHFARRISAKSGVYSASAENVAAHFGVNRKTVDSAAEELAYLGLFGLVRSERFKPNVYRVVDHKEWAERHPGWCVQKA